MRKLFTPKEIVTARFPLICRRILKESQQFQMVAGDSPNSLDHVRSESPTSDTPDSVCRYNFPIDPLI